MTTLRSSTGREMARWLACSRGPALLQVSATVVAPRSRRRSTAHTVSVVSPERDRATSRREGMPSVASSGAKTISDDGSARQGTLSCACRRYAPASAR